MKFAEFQSPDSADDLKGAFTRYVQKLETHGEPDREDFRGLWRALQAALTHEMRKRSLWTASPSYLGVFGRGSWSGKPDASSEALEELLVDCYTLIFVRRLPRLRIQLASKPNIEGVVFRYVRNFLHDRQRDHDPLGYRLFEIVHRAVSGAVQDGELFVLGPTQRLRNDTLLAFSSQALSEDCAAPERLRPLVVSWCDDLLPDLVTATGPARPRVVTEVQRRIFDLAAAFTVFRFGDLLTPLKEETRNRWAAIFDQEGGEAAFEDTAEGGRFVRIFMPEQRAEEIETWKALVDCVSGLLQGVQESTRNLGYLTTLWGFLRTFASDEGPERMPSNRKLATLLRIPRHSFPNLYRILGDLVSMCQQTLSGKPLDEASPEE